MRDIFQPRGEPARSIYRALQAEAEKRDCRSPKEWMEAEKNAVHREAVYQAQNLGLKEPSMQQVTDAERYACGSVDYGAQWAYRVVEAMRETKEEKVKEHVQPKQLPS